MLETIIVVLVIFVVAGNGHIRHGWRIGPFAARNCCCRDFIEDHRGPVAHLAVAVSYFDYLRSSFP
jgi:prolipoprotein diacylglyceryltransferase